MGCTTSASRFSIRSIQESVPGHAPVSENNLQSKSRWNRVRQKMAPLRAAAAAVRRRNHYAKSRSGGLTRCGTVQSLGRSGTFQRSPTMLTRASTSPMRNQGFTRALKRSETAPMRQQCFGGTTWSQNANLARSRTIPKVGYSVGNEWAISTPTKWNVNLFNRPAQANKYQMCAPAIPERIPERKWYDRPAPVVRNAPLHQTMENPYHKYGLQGPEDLSDLCYCHPAHNIPREENRCRKLKRDRIARRRLADRRFSSDSNDSSFYGQHWDIGL